MAQIRQFRCPGCNYCAEVSGGEDRGLDLYTQTISCDGCKDLQDVPVRKFELPQEKGRIYPDPHAKPLVGAWVKFKVGEVTRAAKPDSSAAQFPHLQHYWKPVKLKCHENPFHEVHAWFGMHLPLEEEFEAGGHFSAAESQKERASGRCPKCGQRMVRSQPLATWE